MPHKQKLEILFEDSNVIAVNKPPGILSIPGRHPSPTPTLPDLLQKQHGTLLPVHRLDRDTSGVILYGRHAEAHRHLSLQFEHRRATKTYQAIVRGHPTHSAGTIDLPIAVSSRGVSRVDMHSGKPASTQYQVITYFDGFALVELTPATGRQHQIRVHLKAIGCPLAVDPQYGQPEALSITDIKRRIRRGEDTPRPLLRRTPLHACKLIIKTLDDSDQTFLAEMPKDMRATISQLAKWRAVSDR